MWRGHQMHSHNYRSSSRFVNQVVVVVGNMFSGEPQRTPVGAASVAASVAAVAASSRFACRPAILISNQCSSGSACSANHYLCCNEQ